MSSPLKPQTDNWWDVPVHWDEKVWIGISVFWALVLFGWMTAWGSIGNQTQEGPTYRVSPNAFQAKIDSFKARAEETERGFRPAGSDVYIAGMRYGFDGLPVVLKAGKEYDFHLSSYDVQHGFGVRPNDALSKQMTLQLLPGYEWVLPMTFQEPGTYHVVCNEFCGVGHRTMHAKFIVEK